MNACRRSVRLLLLGRKYPNSRLSSTRLHLLPSFCALTTTFQPRCWFTTTPQVSHLPKLGIDNQDEDDDDERLPFASESESSDDEESSDDDDDEETTTRPVSVGSQSPVYQLNRYYHDNHAINTVTARINAIFLSNRHWTATFQCPITNIEYPAGRLRTSKYLVFEDFTSFPKKQTAIHAAAARALDVIQYRELGIVEPRLCEDDPSLFGREHSDAHDRDRPIETPEQVAVENIVGLGKVVPGEQPGTALALETGHEFLDTLLDEEQDEDWVVTHLPTRTSPPSSSLLQAMDLSTLTPLSSGNPSLPSTETPLHRLKKAIDAAFEWSRSITRRFKPHKAENPHHTILAYTGTDDQTMIGKAILAQLADAHLCTSTSPVFNHLYPAEKAAIRVLRTLWLISPQDKSPDTEVYNLFLQCLSDVDTLTVAKRADEIVQAMKEGSEWSGRILPKPNTETFNVLIQLWAQVGGETGRYTLNDDFRPNRRTFLALLSSCIYRPVAKIDYCRGGFDAEYAGQLISQMEKLAEELGDETLLPDTQVYNAPLPWLGHNFREKRPYAAVAQWSRTGHRRNFEKGLMAHSEDHFRVVQARKMESWLDDMTSRSETTSAIYPNLETHEAVIQAWTRTITRVGLERAHDLALQLLDSQVESCRPALGTFLPVMISWALSREADAPEKNQEIVDRLDAVCDDVPDLRPDGRILQALIATHTVALAKKAREGGNSAEFVRHAERCSLILERLSGAVARELQESVNAHTFLEITPFEDALRAWNQVAKSSIESSKEPNEIFERAILETRNVVSTFDSLVLTIKEAESPDGLGLEGAHNHSLQLMHLLSNAQRVYAGAVIGIESVIPVVEESVSKHAFNEFVRGQVHFIESMLRRSSEYEVAVFTDRYTTSDTEIVTPMPEKQPILPHVEKAPFFERLSYEDNFDLLVYTREVQHFGRVPLISRVMNFMNKLDRASLDIGDYVRVCKLLRVVSLPGRPSRSSFADTIDKLLDRALPAAQHRKMTRPTRETASVRPDSRAPSAVRRPVAPGGRRARQRSAPTSSPRLVQKRASSRS